MNFQQLRIVRETVRRNFNLTEVANALFTSQSGVSKHIKDLEDELGVELFVRRGKRLLFVRRGKRLIGLTDPDPRTDGRGAGRLRAAGIAVTEGICAKAAARTMAGFLARARLGRPHVTLKVAMTLDGAGKKRVSMKPKRIGWRPRYRFSATESVGTRLIS